MKPRVLTHEYQGAGWVAAHCKVELSPLGVVVANILGYVYRGVYHINDAAIRKVDWTDPHFISISVYHLLATTDSSQLTDLVVLAHVMAIRVEIEQSGPGRLRLCFNARDARNGGFSESHPTMEDAVKRVRDRCTIVMPMDEVSEITG